MSFYRGKDNDKLTDLLLHFKGYTQEIARDWSRHEAEFEDLVQAGRIAVWKASLVPVAGTTRRPESFYKQRIRWAIRDEAVRLRREPVHLPLDKPEMETDDSS